MTIGDGSYEDEKSLAEARRDKLPALEFQRAVVALSQAMREMRLTEYERDCIMRVRRLWYNGASK